MRAENLPYIVKHRGIEQCDGCRTLDEKAEWVRVFPSERGSLYCPDCARIYALKLLDLADKIS